MTRPNHAKIAFSIVEQRAAQRVGPNMIKSESCNLLGGDRPLTGIDAEEEILKSDEIRCYDVSCLSPW